MKKVITASSLVAPSLFLALLTACGTQPKDERSLSKATGKGVETAPQQSANSTGDLSLDVGANRELAVSIPLDTLSHDNSAPSAEDTANRLKEANAAGAGDASNISVDCPSSGAAEEETVTIELRQRAMGMNLEEVHAVPPVKTGEVTAPKASDEKHTESTPPAVVKAGNEAGEKSNASKEPATSPAEKSGVEAGKDLPKTAPVQVAESVQFTCGVASKVSLKNLDAGMNYQVHGFVYSASGRREYSLESNWFQGVGTTATTEVSMKVHQMQPAVKASGADGEKAKPGEAKGSEPAASTNPGKSESGEKPAAAAPESTAPAAAGGGDKK